MTISTSTRTAGPFLGNGVTTVLPFTFKVFATTDLVVTNTSAAGADTTLTLGVHYTVSLNSNQDVSPGGNVTMLTAPPTGEKTTVVSAVPDTQTNVFTVGGAWSPTVMNSALDKLTILELQGKANVSRALKIPSSDGTINTELPTAAIRANSIMAFDSAGYPILISQPAGTSINYPNVQGPNGSSLVGFTQSGTGAVTRTVQAKERDTVNAADFGAVGDGVTDDRAAIQLALDSGAKCVYLNAGTFIVGANGGGISLNMRAGVRLIGTGVGTILKMKNNANSYILTISGATDCGISDMVLDGNRTNQSTTCGAIWGLLTNGFICERVQIKNTYSTAMLFDTANHKNITIDNVIFSNIGGGCMYVYNPDSINKNINVSNVYVTSFGVNGAAISAFHIRAAARINGVTIEAVPTSCTGIEIPAGETGAGNGLGGHRSLVSNCRVLSTAVSSNFGISSQARYVTVVNCHVSTLLVGVYITDSRGSFSNIDTDECDYGFSIEGAGVLIPTGTKLSNCNAIRATAAAGKYGFSIGLGAFAFGGVSLSACSATGCAEGLHIGSTITGTLVANCDFTSANTVQISDLSAGLSSYFPSGSIKYTSAGTTNFTVPGGVYQLKVYAKGGGGGGSGGQDGAAIVNSATASSGGTTSIGSYVTAVGGGGGLGTAAPAGGAAGSSTVSATVIPYTDFKTSTGNQGASGTASGAGGGATGGAATARGLGGLPGKFGGGGAGGGYDTDTTTLSGNGGGEGGYFEGLIPVSPGDVISVTVGAGGAGSNGGGGASGGAAETAGGTSASRPGGGGGGGNGFVIIEWN